MSYLGKTTVTSIRTKAKKVSIGAILCASLAAIASAQTVSLTNFGAAGQGGDDTNVIQTAINTTATSQKTLRIPAGAQAYNVWPLSLPNNANIVLDPGVVIQALPGYTENQQMIHIEGVSNVSITGTPGQSVFQMRKADYNSGEYRHCLRIADSSNVVLNGIACNNSGGDGVYVAGTSSGISILNSQFNNNRRQGLTIVSVNGLLVNHCAFTNTNGTGPSDGIDMEPNASNNQLKNIIIENSSVSGNAGNGIMMALDRLDNTSAPVSVTVNGVSSSNNAGSGFVAWNGHDDGTQAVGGSILVENSSSTNDAAYGAAAIFYDATGAPATFQNLVITNANTAGVNVDGAAIAVKRGGGATQPMGNVIFTGISILDPNHHLESYFTVEDYSGVGVRNIYIGNFGTLNGLLSSTTGILNGRVVSGVNIK